MSKIAIVSLCANFQQFFATNQTPAASAYPSLVNLASDIVGHPPAGVIPIKNNGISPYSFADFTFWGQGTAGQTFSAQIVGYRLWEHPNGSGVEYEPYVLADVLCTLGSKASAINASDLMVNTIAINGGVVVGSYEITPCPANCGVQHLKLDLSGNQAIQLLPGTGTVTNLNGKMGGF